MLVSELLSLVEQCDMAYHFAARLSGGFLVVSELLISYGWSDLILQGRLTGLQLTTVESLAQCQTKGRCLTAAAQARNQAIRALRRGPRAA